MKNKQGRPPKPENVAKMQKPLQKASLGKPVKLPPRPRTSPPK